MSQFLILGDSIHLSTQTNHPTSGYYYAADSTPAFYVFEEDSDNAIITGSCTQRSGKPGLYRFTFDATTGNGFEAGKWYHIITSGIVYGVPSFNIVGDFLCASGHPQFGMFGFAPDQIWQQHLSRTITGGDVNVTQWVGDTPNSLSLGRVPSHVETIAGNAINSSALAATAISEIAGGVWDELRSDHQVDGSFGQFVRSSGLAEFGGGGSLTAADVWGYNGLRALSAPVAVSGGNVNVVSMANNTVDAAQFTQSAADKVWSTAARTITGGTVTTVTNPVSVNSIADDTITEDTIRLSTFSQIASGVWNFNGLRALSAPVAVSGGNVNVVSMAANTVDSSQFTQAAADKVWSTTVRTITGGTVGTVSNPVSVNSIADDTITEDTIRLSTFAQIGSGVWNFNGLRGLSVPVAVSGGNVNVVSLANNSITSSVIDSTADTEIAASVWNALRSDYQVNGSFGQFVPSSGLSEYSGSSLTAGDIWSYGGGRTITGGTITSVTNNVNAIVVSMNDDVITPDVISLAAQAQLASGVWNFNGFRALSVPVAVSGGNVNVVSMANNVIDANQFTQSAADKIWSSATRTITGGTITTVTNPVSVNSISDDVITPDVISLAAQAQIASGVWNFNGLRGLSVPVAVSGGNVNVVSMAANTVDASQFTQSAADKVWNTVARTITGGTVTTVSNSVSVNSISDDVITEDTIRLSTFAQIGSGVWNFNGLRALSAPVAVSGGNVHVVSMANNTVDANQFTQSAADKVWSTTSRTITGGTVTSVTNNVNAVVVSMNDDTITPDVLTLSAQAQIASGIWNFNGLRGLSVPVAVSGGNVNVVSMANNVVDSSQFTQSAADKVWATASRTITGGTVTTITNPVSVSSIADDVITHDVISLSAQAQIASGVWNFTQLRSLSVPVAVSGGNVNVVSMANSVIDSNQFTQAAADKVWNTASRTITGGTVTSVTNIVNANVETWRTVVPSGLINGYVITSGIQEFGAAGALTAADIWTYGTRSLNQTADANVVTWRGVEPNNLNAGYVSSSGIQEFGTGSSLTAADIWSHTTRTLSDDALTPDTFTLAAQAQLASGVWNFTMPRSLSVPVAVSGGNVNVVSMASNVVDSSQFTQGAADKVWSTASRTVTGGTITTITNPVSVNSIADDVITHDVLSLSAQAQIASGVWNFTQLRSLSVPVAVSGGNVHVVSMANNVVDSNQFTQGAADKVWLTSSRTVTGGTIDTVNNTVSANVVAMNDDIITEDKIRLSTFAQISSGVWLHTEPRSLSVPVAASGGNVHVVSMAANTVDSSQFTQSAADKVWLTTTKTVTSVTNPVTVTGNPDVNVSTWRGGTPNNLNSGYISSSGINEFGPVTFTAGNQTLINNLVNLDATVSSRATNAGVWTNGTRSLTDPVTISGPVAVSGLLDIYFADVQYTKDAANSRDEYTVSWFKNGVVLDSGITSPEIQVIKRADGTNLISANAMTQIGSTGSYKYDASGGQVASAGEAIVIVVTASIDGNTRLHRKIIGRDSS